MTRNEAARARTVVGTFSVAGRPLTSDSMFDNTAVHSSGEKLGTATESMQQ